MASQPFAWLVRAGIAARGVTYGIIGALALALAAGAGGGVATNQQGALSRLAGAPEGGAAVAAVAAGLLGYALWKFALTATGSGPEGAGGASAGERLRNLAGGVTYCAFFWVAVEVLTGTDSSQSSQPRHTTAGVLGWPGGRWLVGLAGAVVIVVCVIQAREALQEKFLNDSKSGEMSPTARTWFARIGKAGLISRALAFALIGYFLVRAALDSNPAKAVSLDGALRRLAEQPYGRWLLGLVAAGLILFAVYSFVEARYRRL